VLPGPFKWEWERSMIQIESRTIAVEHISLVPASVMRFGGKRMRIKVLPVKILSPPAPVGLITVKKRTLFL
jgi:hypothetical protein